MVGLPVIDVSGLIDGTGVAATAARDRRRVPRHRLLLRGRSRRAGGAPRARRSARARVLRVARTPRSPGSRCATVGERGAAGSRSAASSPRACPTGRKGCTSARSSRTDDPTRARRAPAARRESLPGATGRVARRGARVHGCGHRCRPRAAARHLVGARSRRRVVRPPSHGGADRALPDLPVSRPTRGHRPKAGEAEEAEQSSGVSASTPTTACSRSWRRTMRAGSRCEPRRLDRRAAGPRLVRREPRRHARAHDGWSVPVDAAPRSQRERARPLSFPLFLDPAWDAEVLPVPSASPRAATTSRVDRWDGVERARLVGDVRRLPVREGLEGVPGAARRRDADGARLTAQGRRVRPAGSGRAPRVIRS